MLFSALLYGHTTAPNVRERSGVQANLKEGNQSPISASEPSHSQDVLRRRAEAASQKAATLREKQTRAALTAAIGLFQESARLFNAGHLYDQASDAHLQAGEIYSTVGKYDEARRAYRQAFKVAQSPELRCTALSGIARSYANIGPSSLADSYSRQALTLCERLSDKAQAEAQEARGEAFEFAGEHSRSVDYLIRARDLFEAVRDDDREAQTLLMLAYALFADGKRVEGLSAAGNALRLWSSAANRSGVAHVHAALGAFAITTGEFETAQCNYRLARPLFYEIGSKDDEATILNGMGWVNREMGDWQKSLESYRSARAAFASVRDLVGEQQAVAGEGMARAAMKQYKQLLPLYQAELRLAHEAHDPVLVASSLADMAGSYELDGKYANAETLYRRALEAYRAAGHAYGEGDILIHLGRLLAKQKRYSRAIDSLEQANRLREKTAQVEEIAKVQYELADVYRHMNRLEDARTAIEKTIEIIEAQRVTIAHFESRASYFASVHRYYALYIQVLMLLHQHEPQRGFAQKAFDVSEKSKVRSLLDLLTTSSQEAPCDELLQRQLAIMDEAGARAVDAKQPATNPATSTLTLEQVQAEIQDSDTILLEYALGDQKSYVWAIDQNRVVAHELPRAERIRELVKKFRETLVPAKLENGESTSAYQARVRNLSQEYAPTGRQLSRLLLASVPLAGAKRILIVPDGSLQYIPFAALPLPDSSESGAVLVSHHEIAVLPSASALATLRRAAAKRAPPTALAAIFADPVFEEDDPRFEGRAAHGKTQRQSKLLPSIRALEHRGNSYYIPRLPASRDEANAIARLLSTRGSRLVHVSLDFDANRENVLNNGLFGFRFVHFATHGIIDAQHPEMSALILSLVNERGKRQDGYLRLGDIYQLKLSADLVVLSSCESALGQDLESEGIIGLPRGFLYAGAKSVIASLWKVDDAATAKLMTSLYRRVGGGESPSSALRGAQIEMAHDEQWSNPRYWAAFVFGGDYR
jgi:CHAT domain-containing protein/tetratricopeptide (TPR) repeat protein